MLVGRVPERERVVALVAGGGALVLRGEPGIGKSALLAEAAGERTVRSVATCAESEMPFAALHQLLDGMRPGGTLGRALAAEPTSPQERMAASLELLALLRAHAPLLVVVDDAHLLDAASADALAFAGRRLGGDRVALLLAARADGPPSLADLPELHLAGLPDPAARELLTADTAPHVRDAVLSVAAGNPLALTELPAALSAGQRTGLEPLPDPLPVGPRLRAAVPDPLPGVLLLAALDDTGEPGVLRAAAARLGLDPGTVDDLARPSALQRAAIHAAAGPRRRRDAHLALADVLDGDRRAWHRALAADGPD